MAKKNNNLPRPHDTYTIDDVAVVTPQSALQKPDGTYLPLRPQTFAVLLYFCENSGRTINKDELFKNLWDKADVSDDSLVQCIVEIRHALGRESGKNLRTITRKGYVLSADCVKKVTEKPITTPNTAIVINPFTSTDTLEQKQNASALHDCVITRLVQSKNISIQILSSAPGTQKFTTTTYHLHASLHAKKEKVRAMVYLKDHNNNQIIWAEAYEEKATDSFEIQDKLGQTIANEVITQLKLSLGLSIQQ